MIWACGPWMVLGGLMLHTPDLDAGGGAVAAQAEPHTQTEQVEASASEIKADKVLPEAAVTVQPSK